MKKILFVFISITIIACSDSPKQAEVENIIEKCLQKEPVLDRIEVTVGDSIELNERQLALYKKMRDDKLLTMTEQSHDSLGKWRIKLKEEMKEHVLEEHTDSLGNHSYLVKLSSLKLERVEIIQRIPSTDAAEVLAVFVGKEQTPFYDALKGEIKDTIENRITLYKSGKVWKWCH